MTLRLPKKPKAKETPQSFSSLPFLERVQLVTDKTRAARANKMARQENRGRINKELLRHIWARGMKRLNPEHLAVLKEKDLLILQAHLKTISKAGQNMEEYLTWCMENWKMVIHRAFAKMPNKPEYPIIGFIVKFSDVFLNAFADRHRLEKLADMTPREEAIFKLTEKGMTREAAERKLSQAAEPKPTRTVKAQTEEEARLAEIQRLMKEGRQIKRRETRVRGAGFFGRYEQD